VAYGDVHVRIRVLWAAAKYVHTRNLAAVDVIAEHFMALAIDAGLIDRRGRWDCAGIAEHRRPYISMSSTIPRSKSRRPSRGAKRRSGRKRRMAAKFSF
jgi:hypothetical protein